MATPSSPPTKPSTPKRSSSSRRAPATRKASGGPPTKRLTEAARHFVLPRGITTTAWPSVGETCRRLGATFDPWQEGAAKAILGKNQAGLFAADAVTMSIPRQVGKTYLVGWIVIGLCLTTPKTLAVWTAHHGATAADTFRDLKGICQQPKVAPFVRNIYDSGARLEIIFTNGSRIVFGAREHGFGRGFKKVGILVFDEAQILTAKAVDAQVPTTNRHPNPLIFYMGTPPRPSDPSEHFTELRNDAIGGESTDTLYLEFSADPDADPLDREQWAKANPSYPHHTTARAMLRMRKNLKGPGAFEREALGIWDETGRGSGVFAAGSWARLAVAEQPEGWRTLAVGIAANLDQTFLSLGSVLGGERKHVGSTMRLSSDQAVTFCSEVKRIQDQYDVRVGIDEKGPASFLRPQLQAAGVKLTPLSLDDFVQASADIRQAVDERSIEHANYADLNQAVDSAAWRKVGDRRALGRKTGDIDALEAVAIALYVSSLPDSPEFFAAGGNLDLCDRCETNPHDDPEGVHDYLCPTCREELAT